MSIMLAKIQNKTYIRKTVINHWSLKVIQNFQSKISQIFALECETENIKKYLKNSISRQISFDSGCMSHGKILPQPSCTKAPFYSKYNFICLLMHCQSTFIHAMSRKNKIRDTDMHTLKKVLSMVNTKLCFYFRYNVD